MKRKKAYIDYLLLVILLLLATVCLLSVSLDSNQAALSKPFPLTFNGEYSYDGETWMPLSDDAEISALSGSIILRGHLDVDLNEGSSLYYYRNHIGISMYINGTPWIQDTVTEYASLGIGLLPSMCGREWYSIYSPGITPEDTLEFHLYNPHSYGNKTAYRDFLNTLCCGPDMAKTKILQNNLEPYGQPFRVIGGLFTIMSMILLGAAAASAFLRVRIGGRLLAMGLLTLFVGGFFIFDTIDVCFWNDLVVLNTYSRQLCMMLAVSCLGYCICDALTENRKRVARTSILISLLFNCILIVLSFTGMTVVYDTYIYWASSQWLLCPLLAICCLVQLRCTGRKNALLLVSGILLCATILLDIVGVGSSILSYGTCSKWMFCLLYVVYIIVAVKNIALNYRASIRVKTLEQELQDSRISIMLSQLQPHFLFNVLNSIYHLCRKEPETARDMIDKFSTYLRNNLDSLDQKTMIPFHKELDHIQTYLEMEKLRFGEELTVNYAIQAEHFFLPVLTVQPLVENAVKHGIGKKENGGLLTLATREEPKSYVITVTDTGAGFDPEGYINDGRKHIGIENVRLRLEHMTGGTLKITSTLGEGTTAVITIPKKKNDRYN